jgi:hypothetical protein
MLRRQNEKSVSGDSSSDPTGQCSIRLDLESSLHERNRKRQPLRSNTNHRYAAFAHAEPELSPSATLAALKPLSESFDELKLAGTVRP